MAEVLEFREMLAAAVTAVSPGMGKTQGGTSVQIVGSGFTNITAVKFGATAAQSYTVNSSTLITAVAPAGTAGQVVDVFVNSTGGNSTANANDKFTYVAAPQVMGVSPNSGSTAGGTSVSIAGSSFTQVSAVMFGDAPAISYTVSSSSSLIATAPSHAAGAVDITVVTSFGASTINPTNDRFTYAFTGPTVTGISPGSGTSSGGTSVSITGTGFSGATAVKFGGTSASSFTVVSATSITAVSPAGAAGAVDVRVTNSAGTSPATAADQFTFVSPAPVVTGLGTTTGSTLGGTSVTISGSNFMGVNGVFFGTLAAASYTLNSPASITAVSPIHAEGQVDITVRTPAGTSATNSSDHYVFVVPGAPPTVTSLSVSSGPASGGTTITISGTNFSNVSAVSLGSVSASYFTVISDGNCNRSLPYHHHSEIQVNQLSSTVTFDASDCTLDKQSTRESQSRRPIN